MLYISEEIRVEGRKEETISQEGFLVNFLNGCVG